ncbi:hypothetical protein SIO70_02510 [Chitinophaga sancti]|uniref:hypothetical protein n=1 Tax=Chitinophaga sancti TaxID=1004 RepID=UPI002A7554A0|nr:hypothetical protein [Chitinophaga sancti]WPQ63730.1 hypothetical protein SIO70_02510 [Chitinophaga sancti]
MKRYLIGLLVMASFGAMTSCSKDDDNTTSTTDSTYVTLSGDIKANQTLSADKKYMLKGFVYVMSGATLTIEPGTIIVGDKASKGTLVVTRGGKINATGTAAKPIIFTSAQEVGARQDGDWGGIILLGKAPINATGGEAKIEGGLTATNGGDEKTYIYYGGTDAADNSGVLKYVRIEFAGVAYSPDNEINGLTMGGVGSGTTISYVQVYRSGDDSFEWFGGTVNCDHLVATYTWDDDFDTDNGFSGRVQFGLAQRFRTIADQSGSNGFESDNDATGSSNTPQTKAVFSNMTIVGPGSTGSINANYQHGVQIRRNSSMSLYNSLIIGFPYGFYLDDSKVVSHKTSANASEGTLVFSHNIIAGSTTAATKSEWSTTDNAAWTAWWATTSTTVLTNATDVLLANPYLFSAGVSSTNVGTPSFLLKTGSPALTGADFSNLTTGFTATTYIGAFDGTTDWTTGWTTAGAETTVY